MDGCRGTGLTTVSAALDALDAVAPLPARSASLAHALHRVLARPVHAACDLPPFTQSAVDGYAVRHADLAADALPLAGAVRAGVLSAAPALVPGTAQRIFTGGMLPAGADTVVRQEWARAEGGDLRVLRRPQAGADVRAQGEELRAGAVLAPPGLRLTPAHLGALAAAGVRRVDVHDAPRVALLVTGDEVVRPGAAARFGQVPDANGPLVTAWLAARGYDKVRAEHVPDSAEATRVALRRALEHCDLVLTTGGVSVGEHDHVPEAAERLGARRLFWKVAQKPGKPLYAALGGRALLLGLPGNPAAVLVNLVVHVTRALDALEGVTAPGPASRTGVLESALEADAERDRWLRMGLRYDETGTARLQRLPRQGSHMLSNLMSANALAWIPAATQPLPAGSVVRWFEL